ncbi:MAG: M15 family metallopeptidase [Bacteroidetes bacterium]|nr:M15 family metallopeptidase [Bacteroidota bacterium]
MFYKVIKGFLIFQILILFSSTTALSQKLSYTRPEITNSFSAYKKQCKEDTLKRMVELKKLIPSLVYDLRYASTHNFMNRLMYPQNTKITFLRLSAAKALQQVQEELSKQGLGLKIFDAYRPYSVTEKFWELVKDERYVANPAKGSGHNRGAAVDLTIIHLTNAAELNMGTGFDNFTDTAHQTFTKLPEEVLKNRLLLKSIMEKHGFLALETEWWHYYLPDSKKYELLNIPFKKLAKE